MSIIQKLLGGPGFFMEADEETLASIKSAEPKPAKAPEAKVEAPAAPPVVEQKVVAEAPVVEAPPAPPATSSEVTVTETAPVAVTVEETPVKADNTAAAVADPVPAANVTGAGPDIQALVDAAIAQASTEAVQSAEAAAEQTFATDYLLVDSMKGRRKPGPSLTGFMDMAGTMRR